MLVRHCTYDIIVILPTMHVVGNPYLSTFLQQYHSFYGPLELCTPLNFADLRRVKLFVSDHRVLVYSVCSFIACHSSMKCGRSWQNLK